MIESAHLYLEDFITQGLFMESQHYNNPNTAKTHSQELENQDFEQLLSCVREIITKLNSQEINLKDSLSLYKQGVHTLSLAQKLLESAQLEFEELQNQF
ncbi:MAG: exodeoxyribonuclease VII small subunit [Helicobacter sp.]|uniref:exodeoxyribonuclease VII small subunit n=1 Tax=Helicobacter sp. 10-6591 TaxID=2004998 RepID=UPI000DCC9B3E|nr:exodeoxyribonuclease VII small subunit [Helicobacter sp. 10-6591]MDD7566992.1 exodeoxyribonuclease VII small subunit [Helicobacter sp.]MDY5741205.1 exodeoxyribonuclease VII small subunit [Helicobacter sp.]RAX54784.1 exodeoxyribonuclease VII small subunit [Helicobacter sp. 10-6591]